MELPQENEPEFDEQYDDQEDAVEIYSRNAILGFSISFSTVFGGALLVINLFKAGLRSAAWLVLAFAVGYHVTSFLAVRALGLTGNVLLVIPILLNVTGGLILTNYFFPKYFPDNDYYPRSIWGALMVSIIISFTFILFAGHLIDPSIKPLK